ncbi:RDD family protein [Parahaliea maris]|uniref:RDD family protein n=1 Tax=Parahaliea maris TaxID=2716870 RepID=A0A5C9A5Z4_9GAMM|nr:RDD family protein [Parahaliea maris]TXS95464.1 RDD family protein [Parahaliea maris]
MPESRPPALPRRLIAMVYDTFLVLPLIMLNVGIAMALHGAIARGDAEPLHPQLVQLIALVTVIGFFSAFWLKSGQTLGMQAWRIKLVASDGSAPGWSQSVRRCLGALLSAACLGMGYWWCLFDRRGRYWHDYLSGTELLLVDKPPRKKKGKAAEPAA